MKDSIFSGLLPSRRKASKGEAELSTRWGDLSISAPTAGGWNSSKPANNEGSPDSRYEQPPTPPLHESAFDVTIVNESDQVYEDERFVAFKLPTTRHRPYERPRQHPAPLGFFKPELPGVRPLSPPSALASNSAIPTHQAYTSPSLGSILSPVDETFAKAGPSRHASPVLNQDVRSMIESALAGMDSVVRTPPPYLPETFSQSPLSLREGSTGFQRPSGVGSIPKPSWSTEVSPVEEIERTSTSLGLIREGPPRAAPTPRPGKRSQSADPFTRNRQRSASVDRPSAPIRRKGSLTLDTKQGIWDNGSPREDLSASTVFEDATPADNSTHRLAFSDRHQYQQGDEGRRMNSSPFRATSRPQPWQASQTIGLPMRPNTSLSTRRPRTSNGDGVSRPTSTESFETGYATIPGPYLDSDVTSLRSATSPVTSTHRTGGLYNEIESDYAKLRHDLAPQARQPRAAEHVTDESNKKTGSSNRQRSTSRLRGLKHLGSRHRQRIEHEGYVSASDNEHHSAWESELVARRRHGKDTGGNPTSPTFSNSNNATTATNHSNTTPPLSASLSVGKGSEGFSHSRQGSDTAPVASTSQQPAGPAPKELVPSNEEIWG